MAVIVDDPTFIRLCEEFDYNVPQIVTAIKERYPSLKCVRPSRVTTRINGLRTRGVLPLDSANSESSGELLKGDST